MRMGSFRKRDETSATFPLLHALKAALICICICAFCLFCSLSFSDSDLEGRRFLLVVVWEGGEPGAFKVESELGVV